VDVELVPLEDIKAVNELWTLASDNQKRFLQMRVRCENDKECADLLKLDPSTVCQWRSRHEYFARLEGLYKNLPTQIAMMYLNDAMPETVVKQIEIMRNSKNDRTQLEATKALQKLAIDIETLKKQPISKEDKFSLTGKKSYEDH
jgi:hypothetical protein